MKTKQITPPVNKSLAKKFPHIAKEWHPTKNNSLTPLNFFCWSHKKAWWVCDKCGYEWSAHISSRSKGNGCPSCAGKVVTQDSCLANKRPLLCREWDYRQNGTITPYNTSYASNKRVWWICSNDNSHKWIAMVSNRTKIEARTGCPYCYGTRVTDNNRLSVKCPLSIKIWNYGKNGGLTPDMVHFKSHKKAWWICSKGHEWEEVVFHVSSDKRGCPYCSNRRVDHNNCLATTHPLLAKEWHSTKNGNITPYGVVAGSGKKIWWKCSRNPKHEWRAVIYSRTLHGCPYCSHIELKNGCFCQSIPEAIKYLEYKARGLTFEHNKQYSREFGLYRYDFFFPLENKYVEVTSFDKNHGGRWHFYYAYLRNIVKKKQFVENVLGAKFEFIQFRPNRAQLRMVNNNRK